MNSSKSKYKMCLSHVFGMTKDAYLKHARWISNAGGCRSGKTYSTLQLLLLIALQRPNTSITVTSENLPHLKRGAMKDFERILAGLWPQPELFPDHNKANNTYTFKHNKSYIEFVSFADEGRARGPQRDILYVNEINNCSKSTIEALSVRTGKCCFVDYNPVAPFWFNDEIETMEDCIKIHSTYKDNDFLSQEQVKEIERHNTPENQNWWRVYGLGLVGVLDGACIQGWDTCKELPVDDERTYYGMDFGFVNDATTIVKVVRRGDDIYVQQLVYQVGLTNPEIARLMKLNNVGRMSRVVADSAEMKSIQEINAFGFRVSPVRKFPNSIMEGLQVLQNFRIHVTEDSVDLIRELRNYVWETDKITGAKINRPIDCFNHAIDALRYVALTYLKPKGYVSGSRSSTFTI